MPFELQWSVFLARLDPAEGSEQRGTRPVLVISAEDFNEVMPNLTVLPLTSRKEGRRVYPNEVLLRAGIAGLTSDSLVLCHQIRTISKTRLANVLGPLSSPHLRQAVRLAVRFHLDF